MAPFVLPAWLTQNVRSPKSLKLLFRCWLASWLAFVLLLPHKSLQTLGNAAFFGVIVSLILPPNMPVQMFLFVIATLFIGLLLGWALGAAAMRAALAARSQVLLQQTFQKVQQSAAGLANPDALYQVDIFQGWFLDPRSTVVYGVFLGVFNFLFALMRAYMPNLIFTSLFGPIALDIFCSYAPLFPFATYTLLNSLLISTAAYTGLACLAILFIFPETVSHAYLDQVRDVIGQWQAMVSVQEEVLSSGRSQTDGVTEEEKGETGKLAGTAENFEDVKKKIDGMRATAFQGLQLLDSKIRFVDLEFSYGKWNSDDLQVLQEPLKALAVRVVSLQILTRLLWRIRTRQLPSLPDSNPNSNPSTPTATVSATESTDSVPLPQPESINGANASRSVPSQPNPTSPDTELLHHLYAANIRLEATHNVTPDDMLPLLREVTAPLRTAIVDGLTVLGTVVESVNKRRWSWGEGARKPDEKGAAGRNDQDLEEATERLRKELNAFREGRYKELVEPFVPLLSGPKMPDFPTPDMLPLRSLYLAYVFCATLIATAEGALSLFDNVVGITKKRSQRRLWAPGGLRKLWKVLAEREPVGAEELGEDGQGRKGEAETSQWEREARRDPDSRPPENAFQRVMNGLHAVYGWLKSVEVMFALKYAVLTIALWLPAVFRHSAGFYYEQKGVWALIMAQMTLNVYASDQIFNYFTRLVGTLVGLIFGLLVWYIGDGNPYGVAASMAVFMIPTMFLRLFAPPAFLSGVITAGVTIPLIVGYSWIDGHLPTYGNPGVGWPIAWKRWVLVVIGSAASFIIMMLPPKSGRKAVRLRNATTIKRIGNLYSLLISRWINSSASTTAVSEGWSAFFRADLVSIAEQLYALKGMTAIAKWEGSIRGRWPFEEYDRLVDVQIQMLGNLAQLGGALAHMNEEWRLALLHRTRVLNPNFITDVLSLFSLLSQSLQTGEPLHEVLPQTLFARLAYHHHQSTKMRETLVELPQLEQLQSLDYMIYANGMAAVLELITGLDELHAITRRLCGEMSLKGFDQWRSEYLRRLV